MFSIRTDNGNIIIKYTVDPNVNKIGKRYLPFFFECDYIDFMSKKFIISLKEKCFYNFINLPVVKKMQRLFEKYRKQGEESMEAILVAIGEGEK